MKTIERYKFMRECFSTDSKQIRPKIIFVFLLSLFLIWFCPKK